MSLLSKLLAKRGINKEEDLSPEEQATFNKFKVVLARGEVTVDTIKEFCEYQISVIQGQFDGKTPITPIQQACLHVYLSLKKAIEGPQAEREALERQLNAIINES